MNKTDGGDGCQMIGSANHSFGKVGEDAYFFGKKHTDETKEKMRRNHKQPLTEDSKRRIGEAASKRFKGTTHNHTKCGSDHPTSISVMVNGVIYSTITEASNKTGISYYMLRKYHTKISQV